MWVTTGTLEISGIPKGLKPAQNYGVTAKRLSVGVPTLKFPESRTCSPWPRASCWGQFQHHDCWMCVYRGLGPKMAKSGSTAVACSGIGLILPHLRHWENKGDNGGTHSTWRAHSGDTAGRFEHRCVDMSALRSYDLTTSCHEIPKCDLTTSCLEIPQI